MMSILDMIDLHSGGSSRSNRQGPRMDTFESLAVEERCFSLSRSEASSGSEAKSLKDTSDIRGDFHGKRRSIMQQRMMASDHTSDATGSYLISEQTSGDR